MEHTVESDAHGWSPNHYCPECGNVVKRTEPAWIDGSGQLHHDPCPTRDLPPGGGRES